MTLATAVPLEALLDVLWLRPETLLDVLWLLPEPPLAQLWSSSAPPRSAMTCRLLFFACRSNSVFISRGH
jgi:hypothetical protein